MEEHPCKSCLSGASFRQRGKQAAAGALGEDWWGTGLLQRPSLPSFQPTAPFTQQTALKWLPCAKLWHMYGRHSSEKDKVSSPLGSDFLVWGGSEGGQTMNTCQVPFGTQGGLAEINVGAIMGEGGQGGPLWEDDIWAETQVIRSKPNTHPGKHTQVEGRGEQMLGMKGCLAFWRTARQSLVQREGGCQQEVKGEQALTDHILSRLW